MLYDRFSSPVRPEVNSLKEGCNKCSFLAPGVCFMLVAFRLSNMDIPGHQKPGVIPLGSRGRFAKNFRYLLVALKLPDCIPDTDGGGYR